MKIDDKKKADYSFEEIIIEGVRRGYLTETEGRLCMSNGFVSDEMLEKFSERIKKDPDADIPGSKRIASTQEHMKQFLKIRFSVNPNSDN